MNIPSEEASKLAQELHTEEENLKAIAATMPEDEKREQVFMTGERLSDKAWAIEEGQDDSGQE